MRCIACNLCKKSAMIPESVRPDLVPVAIRAQMVTATIPMAKAVDKLVQCPLCGPSARKHLNIPKFLSQYGWTTPDGVNTYYTALAKEEAEYLADKEIQKRQQNGEISSNSQKKKLMRTLMETIKTELLNTKYKEMIVADEPTTDY